MCIPVAFEAEVPSWQDYSKLRFFVAKGDSNHLFLAIVAAGKQLYDVELSLTSNGRPVILDKLVLKQLDHSHMAVVELESLFPIDDLSDLRITRFSAVTK